MTILPSAVSLRKYIDYVQPQENVGCCTSCAVLLAAEIISAIAGHKINFSRLYLYYMTRKAQNRLGQHGAELKETLNALVENGVPLDKSWPFTLHRVDIRPSRAAMEEAISYRQFSYQILTPGDYKNYLNLGIPIIIGLKTGKLFWELSGELSEQAYKPINNKDNRESNGHAVTIIGYDDTLNGGSWIIANSLGLRWGSQGFGATPYICNNDICESYAITYLPK